MADAKKSPVWIDAASNPWHVPILDVRPVTLTMLSVSKDPHIANNALSYGREDGSTFVNLPPQQPDRIVAKTSLRFRIDRLLADGAIFLPRAMEHKWAIFVFGGKLIFVRSWLRQVFATAVIRPVDTEQIEIAEIRGSFGLDADAEYTVRVFEYLMQSHALRTQWPAPFPLGADTDPNAAALWCMSAFGKMAHFATVHPLSSPNLGEQPLRSYSRLHIAACGDAAAVRSQLAAGLPFYLLDPDGAALIHWAVSAQRPAEIIDLLISAGCPVDLRAGNGDTALMSAAQQRKAEVVAHLLSRGAQARAADGRGFTALHRAAEMGEVEIVRQLLAHGASPDAAAQGHTPRSLAIGRGEKKILDLFR